MLGGGCLLLFGVHLQRPIRLDKPLREMPLVVAGFSGADRVISKDEQAVVGMSDYIFRAFKTDSSTFSVYVGYYESQTTGQTIHSPKNCLPGAGWEALESSVVSVPAEGGPVSVNRYLLANGSSRALVYYWYQGRGRVAHSEYRVKWDLMKDAMRYGRSEEALVRVVVPIGTGSASAEWGAKLARAERIAEQATTDLVPRVRAVLPRWSSRGPSA